MTTAASGWRGTTRPGGWGHLLFDGTDDRVSVADAPALRMSGAMTVAAWIYLTATPSGVHYGIASKGNSASGVNWSMAVKATTRLLYWHVFNGASIVDASSSTAIPLNTWTHVAIAYDGTNANFYQNGLANGSTTVATGITGTDPVLIGGNTADGNNAPFPGPLDDISLWNRALSAAEIQAEYNLSRGGYPGVLNRVGAPAASVSATTASGDGAAAGVGTAVGVGAALAVGAGTAAGLGLATGAGAALATADGLAAGSGAATGTGASLALATGAALAVGAGTAAGLGLATGAGAALATADGLAAGSGAATGTGASLALATGAAAGVGTATGRRGGAPAFSVLGSPIIRRVA